MPNILVTNDDGIAAAGLRVLAKSLADIGTVTVVAPSQERSASAQSLTLRQPIFCEQVAERDWSVEGTPVDAMILAFHTLLAVRPDLVVSGINRGSNLGENVYYSGTIGAAMEGAINGVPSIAISIASRAKEVDFTPAAEFIQRLAPLVLEKGLPKGVLLNVNVPVPWNGGVRFTRQSPKVTRNVLQRGEDPRGRTYYWLNEQRLTEDIASDTDHAAILAGEVSVTPLLIDHTDASSLNHLSHWKKLLEEK
jgi:5'-nucleotidase